MEKVAIESNNVMKMPIIIVKFEYVSQNDETGNHAINRKNAVFVQLQEWSKKRHFLILLHARSPQNIT